MGFVFSCSDLYCFGFWAGVILNITTICTQINIVWCIILSIYHVLLLCDCNIYILLDILVCSIAVYFYESCSILASPKGESKYK